ncbi:hypothetical protein [Bacteroides fragilis]|uniref:hypothetical protein n=1 Tax=Bacteroides fragilis TaxID=817 RepID=UPI001C7068CA|nr:hypothetical protein [Bacteroides fragilis]
MTENDQELIKKAWDINCIYWYNIDEFMEQADTPEAKELLRVIRSFKYHMEEASCGTL